MGRLTAIRELESQRRRVYTGKRVPICFALAFFFVLQLAFRQSGLGWFVGVLPDRVPTVLEKLGLLSRLSSMTASDDEQIGTVKLSPCPDFANTDCGYIM